MLATPHLRKTQVFIQFFLSRIQPICLKLFGSSVYSSFTHHFWQHFFQFYAEVVQINIFLIFSQECWDHLISICNDTQVSGHASCTVNHTGSTTQCQQAHAHTFSFYIPVSAPMIQLSLCGLDMLAGRLRLKCDGHTRRNQLSSFGKTDESI